MAVRNEQISEGQKKLDAVRQVLNAALQQAVVDYGLQGKRLDRKRAAENVADIADRVALYLIEKLGGGGEADRYRSLSEYDRAVFLGEKYGFSKSQFVQTVQRQGLTEAVVQHIIDASLQYKEQVHRGAATSDVGPTNLETVLRAIESKEGIVIDQRSRNDWTKMEQLIYSSRVGQAGSYIDNVPGIRRAPGR